MGVKLYNEEDVQDIAKVVRYGTSGTMRVEDMPNKIFDAMASTTSTTDNTEAYEKVMPTSVCGKVGSINGKSLVWNQLSQRNVSDSNISSYWNTNNGSFSNGKAIFTGTSGTTYARDYFELTQMSGNYWSYLIGHKYLLLFKYSITEDAIFEIRLGGDSHNSNVTLSKTNNVCGVYIDAINTSSRLQIFNGKSFAPTADFTFEISSVKYFDLTMLGDTTLSVEAFTSMFPNWANEPYDSGTIKSYPTTEVVVSGKNLFNPNATIQDFNYISISGTSYTRKGIFITDIKGTYSAKAFYIGSSSDGYYYLGLKNKITTILTSPIQYFIAQSNTKSGTFEIGDNEELWLYDASTGTNFDYLNQYNIDIVKGSTIPTEHTEYKSPQTIQLSTWNGYSAGSVADEYGDGVVTNRVGVVDLGSLSWEYQTLYKRFRANALENMFWCHDLATINQLLCSKYSIVNGNMTYYITEGSYDKVLATGGTGANYIYIRDDSYTDASTFKQAMQGVLLYYELATPTTESVPQIPIFDAEQNGSVRFRSLRDSIPYEPYGKIEDANMPVKSDITYLNKI